MRRQQRIAPTASELQWRIVWTQAFPTLFRMEEDSEDDSFVWFKLAFDTLWSQPVNSAVIDDSTELDRNVQNANDNNALWENSLGYGEITSTAVFTIVQTIRAYNAETVDSTPSLKVVIDLGSGTGRVLVACALLLLTQSSPSPPPLTVGCMGLELVPALHTQAMQQRDNCIRYNVADTVLDLRCADFTVDTNWIDATTAAEVDTGASAVIFIHCTVFEAALMMELTGLLLRVRPGTWIVTVSRPLPSACAMETYEGSICTAPFFERIDEINVEMSWGRGAVFLQRRTNLLPISHNPSISNK